MSPKGQSGQATPEYVGLVLLVATVLGALLTIAGPALPGGGVARAVASKLVCAVKGSGECGGTATALAARPTATQRAYGADVAALLAEHVPTIAFEADDFVSLPVDYRECRQRSCADSILHGSIQHTQTGLEPTVFTHVVDCTDAAGAARRGYDCSGERAGNVYLQYWLYYPDSETHGLGSVGGYHSDDWESYQVRVAEDGTATARASSHHGYNGRRGGDVGSDTGWWGHDPGWDSVLGQLHVAAGSHAGMSAIGEGDDRRIEPSNLRLVPAEPIARGGRAPSFAITPPWEKEVWSDPESSGT
jgi:hypothetical protein